MKITKEFKIGFFIVTVLVASFFVINFLRGKDIFGNEVEYVCYYDNLEGLVATAPVMIKGFQAGSVTEVEYLPQTGNFKVTCSVLKDFSIPVDSKMALFSTSIMGGKGIEIVYGSSSEIAQDGAQLAADSVADLMTSLGSSIGPLMENLTGMMDSLKVTVSSLNKMLSDENQQSITKSLKNLDRTLAHAQSILKTVDSKSGELDKFITNLSEMSSQIDPLLKKADSAMKEVNGIAAQLNASDIEGLLKSVNSLLENVQDPDGSLGKLINNGDMYTSVNELLNDVSSLVKKIEQNPKKYIRISIF